MKKLILALLITAATLSALDSYAQSRRLGGGFSKGKQSQNVNKQAPAKQDAASPASAGQANPAAAPAAAPGALPPKPASPWKGMLGGALLGLGLGALLSSMGFGAGMANFISILLMLAIGGGVIYLLFRLFGRKPRGAAPEPAFADGSAAPGAPFIVPKIGSGLEPPVDKGAPAFGGVVATAAPTTASATAQNGSYANGMPADTAPVAAQWGVPADFDVPGFLRNAKTYYIRLQAAWDKGDTSDIREFSTTEMFAELKLQLQERGATPNQTDVVTLDADLLGIETVGADHLASVKFSGMIREGQDATAVPFAEVWNLSKPVKGNGGWVLAGIQQLS